MNHLIDGLLAARDGASRFAQVPSEPARTYSYDDVRDVSGRLAQRLVDLGVAPGDRVAVQVEKSFEGLMLYLATVRAGGVFLPLNTGYTPGEVEYFVGDAEPRIVVADPSRGDVLTPIAERCGARLVTMGVTKDPSTPPGSLFEDVPPEGTAFEGVARGPDDLAAILYTSGTTGRSKGAMLSHANLLANAVTLASHWQFTSDDVLIHALPIFHTHGLFVATNVVVAAGASLILLPRFDPDAVLEAMPRATALMGVPTFYTRLLDHPGLTEDRVANMRLFVSGSAPLLAETHERWRERTGHAILERYGMTETNMNTSNPYEGERRAGTVGMALPDVEVRIADAETGDPLDQGEIGSIEVRGPNVFEGYWRMPEKTAEEFREGGWFVTGDVGQFDESGYLTIVGRSKDLVISGGFNVYPKEVEALIDEIEGVKESAVIGLPHPDFGEGVAAAVVLDHGATLTAADVEGALKDRLARYKQPKLVVFVDELPRNTMGKVQKAALRETYADAFSG